MCYEKPLKIKEFAEALNISLYKARRMAKSEIFRVLKITIDAARKSPPFAYRRNTDRRNRKLRIFMSRYKYAKDKGLL